MPGTLESRVVVVDIDDGDDPILIIVYNVLEIFNILIFMQWILKYRTEYFKKLSINLRHYTNNRYRIKFELDKHNFNFFLEPMTVKF